jgi:hypothetical protein
MFPPAPSWITFHPALRPSMRAILLDWLRECSDGYKLSRNTCGAACAVALV